MQGLIAAMVGLMLVCGVIATANAGARVEVHYDDAATGRAAVSTCSRAMLPPWTFECARVR